ncbi:MAG: amidohydrolase family protein [Tepidisphaeraceae bacterium]
MIQSAIRGPLLIPRDGGRVDYFVDGVLAWDHAGVLQHAGAFAELKSIDSRLVHQSDGVLIPPLVDIHIHIPQHPIAGHFVDGVPDNAPGGKLLAGLHRNVFPAEAKCNDPAHAEAVTQRFLQDTLSHGVVGGCAYMTTSPAASDAALSILPDFWSVGLVLMNQDTPEYLVTDEVTVEVDMAALARKFGQRYVATDRFAIAVTTPLRQLASKIASAFGLRTQTHLNEQVGEKDRIERVLYPNYASYTDVYHRDGLLDHSCILAHCIHMRPDEWSTVRDTGSVIAHCPTSNLLLGSGVMQLDEVKRHGIPYAIATDVGASPTVSMLAEMRRFLEVHRGRSSHATPSEALYRATRAPANLLGINAGTLEVGRPASFIEIEAPVPVPNASADDVIRSLLPANIDQPAHTVRRVTLAGQTAYDREVSTRA